MKKIILNVATIAASILLIIILSGFAPVPSRVIIDFDKGTTLEQAGTWLSTLDTTQASVNWHLPVSEGEGYSTGIVIKPNQDYTVYDAEQWQNYINFLHTAVPGHAKQTAGRKAMLVQASSTDNCWTTQTCPALMASQADLVFASVADANSVIYPAFAHPQTIPAAQFFFHLVGQAWRHLVSI